MMMTIGDFARACGLSPKALRLYDESGLLVPAEVDAVTGYRWYDERQLERATLVARCRLAGLPLALVRQVADLPSRSAAAALTSYWRQAEADRLTAGGIVADLVAELSTKEHDMSTTLQQTPDAASSLEQGGRDRQLDAVLVEPGVYAVADGFGGSPGLAADVLAQLIGVADAADAVAALDEALTRGAALVAERHGAGESGCTVTGIALREGQAAVVHVGDSRAYLVREGRLERLTRDHTVVQALVDEGRLSPEEARLDERRPLLNRAVAGDAPYAPDLALHRVQPGDRLVLTTDGVHAMLPPEELAGLLVADAPPGDVVGSVVAAVRAVGEPDNHAVVVVDLP